MDWKLPAQACLGVPNPNTRTTCIKSYQTTEKWHESRFKTHYAECSHYINECQRANDLNMKL